jgi:hypothetical protein
MLLAAVLPCASPAAEPMTYIYHPPESALDVRYLYHWDVLKTALDKTNMEWGPYRMVRSGFMTERRQAYELKNATGKLTVMYLSTTPDFESHLVPVRIPVDRNLGGYCVFLVRAGEMGASPPYGAWPTSGGSPTGWGWVGSTSTYSSRTASRW